MASDAKVALIEEVRVGCGKTRCDQEQLDEEKPWQQKNAARVGGGKTVTSLMRRNHGREPDILCDGVWRLASATVLR